VWQNLGNSIADKPLSKAEQEQWEHVRWEQAAAQYRERMLRLYSKIKMFGSPRPTDLDGIYTNLHILDKPSASRRFDITQIKKDPEPLKKAERINGLELVSHPDYDRLFLLGKPGAGKTTFLRYLTLQAIKGRIEAIPMFVTLKEWADSGKELMPFLVQQFEICNFPDAELFIRHTLVQGKALVLFDGLDEVQQENNQRKHMIKNLQDFSDQYLDSQMVVSCRIAATNYSFKRFTDVEVADFDEAQVRTFVTRWFGEDDKQRDAFFAEYNKEEHRGLRDMGRVPLLLSLLCLTFEQRLSFPPNRGELYEEAIDILLSKWDELQGTERDEVYQHLSKKRKKQVLSQVAFETFTQDDYFIKQNKLANLLTEAVCTLLTSDQDIPQEIDGEDILKAIEAHHGILVERAYQIYSFAHLSFQEYFTARFIATNTTEESLHSLFQEHLTDSRWREVFLLTASLLKYE
jgi:predicted NACHT family NTPase